MTVAQRLLAVLACLPALVAAQDSEPGRPLWEVGVVAGGGSVADYPGADQSHTRGLLVPALIYRGPVLRVEGGAIRGRLRATRDVEVDVSAMAAFNARDNDARAGMPGLDYLFGIGPQLIYKGWRDVSGAPTAHLRLHAVMSTDFERVDRRGYTLQPALNWRWRPWSGAPATLAAGIEATWASRELQRYFYEVAPAHARAERPAYAARAGYLGSELKLTLTRRFGPTLSGFAGVRLVSLHGAANRDSPLLRRDVNVNLGAGVVWTPLQSAAPAEP